MSLLMLTAVFVVGGAALVVAAIVQLWVIKKRGVGAWKKKRPGE